MPSSPRSRSIAGVPSSRVLPSFPITAPPPVCVLAEIGVLAVWLQNKPKKTHPPSSSKFTPFCSGGVFQYMSLSADPKDLLCKKRI